MLRYLSSFLDLKFKLFQMFFNESKHQMLPVTVSFGDAGTMADKWKIVRCIRFQI